MIIKKLKLFNIGLLFIAIKRKYTSRIVILASIVIVLFALSVKAQQEINLADFRKGGGTVVSFPTVESQGSSNRRRQIAPRVMTGQLLNPRAAGRMAWFGGMEGPPLYFVFSFRGMCSVSISSIVLNRVITGPGKEKLIQVKDFKVEISNSSPIEEFRTVGQFTLKDSPTPQTFNLAAPVSARFVKIRILSNNGGKGTALGGGIQFIGKPLSAPGRQCLQNEASETDAKIVRISATDGLLPADRAERESNDTPGEANPIVPGISISGRIEKTGEVDYYRLRLKPEERGIINLKLQSRPFLRTDMELLDKRGEVINRISGRDALGLEKSYSLNLTDDEYFFKLSQPGMSILMLVDNSGSMKGRESQLRSAVEQFVSERNEMDRVAILNFSRGAQTNIAISAMLEKAPKALRERLRKSLKNVKSQDVCQGGKVCKPLGGGVGQFTDFNSDPKILREAAAKTGNAAGGTPLNRAMLTAFEKLEKEKGNKAILLFSDGADTASQLEYSKVWEMLEKDLGIRIYTVGLGRSLLRRQAIGITGRNLLRHWSHTTNGRSFFTLEPAKLTEFYSQISREISEPTRYRLEIGVAAGTGTLDVLAQGERLPAEVTSRRVELIFDASGSMLAKIGGKTRIDIAKEVVRELIGNLPDDTEVGLRAFGHRRKGDCKDIELISPFAKLNKPKLIAQINGINARGNTPLAESLRLVGVDMAGYSGDTTLIILTDGKEQCRGNPVAEVRKLQRKGIDVNLHVIGFAVDEPSVRQLSEIAKAGGGQFHKAADSKELVSALKTSLGVRFEVRDATGKVVARGVTGAQKIELTEGFYRIVIKAKPEIEVKDVFVKKGQKTTVVVTKEGSEINTEVREPQV
ncbi:MAG: VWA domain-containing protein [Pyrinomonadaceae bacterium]|nr:VWA domain-containing protein [Pyrinomonadaceae bacterium]